VSIEWTNATWNPVTGCTKVSPGCKQCYAETFAERFRGVPGSRYEQGFDLRLWPERLELPLRWKKPRKVFVNSMSDLFHERVPFEFIDQAFDTMRRAGQHQFQILTKRATRMQDYITTRSWARELAAASPNIWLGASVELEAYMPRAEIVAGLPSRVRFLSCEPLLGPLDLSAFLAHSAINWVIVGGESGAGARPMDPAWAGAIRDQCHRAGVAFFFKQWGGFHKNAAGRLLDGRTWDEFPEHDRAQK
jgi:protein gp37